MGFPGGSDSKESACNMGDPAFHMIYSTYKIISRVKIYSLCDPMDYRVQGVLQARILEWVPFSSPGDLPNQGI